MRAWALRIPPEAENIDLFQKAVFSSFLCDPSMAVAWVGTLPPGWHRELAAAAAARTLRWRQRPDEAAACFDLITDPLVRERAKKDGVR